MPPRPKPTLRGSAAEKLLANTVIENFRVEVVAAMKAAVIVFPGSTASATWRARSSSCRAASPRWCGTPRRELPAGTDLVVLPGGFSYGDYLRCGAIAARAPIMDAVRAHAAQGRAGARRLQRLPDPVRGRTAARHADAQRQREIHLPRRASEDRALRHAVHARLQCRPGDPRAGRAWRGQLLRERRHDRRGSRRRGASCSATPTPDGKRDPKWNVNGATNRSPAC